MTRSPFLIKLMRKLRLPNDDENIRTTIENLRSGTEMSGVSLWVLVAAIFIASLGLNINAAAVIIGAMLVSPLMGPIMGFGLGLGISDFGLIKTAVKNFTYAVLISIITSTVYFFISPVKEAGSELLARTSPTIYDVLIAFFGGVAGIIAGASVLRRSNVIPGVAIATALMPPLCTVGYGLANFNFLYAAGAFYLFLINSVFISIATFLIVRLLNYPRLLREETGKSRLPWMMTFLVIVMTVPSIYLTYHIVKKYFYQQKSQKFIRNELQEKNRIVVTSSLNYKPGRSRLELVLMGSIIDSNGKAELQNKMLTYGLSGCELILHQGPDSRETIKEHFDELSTNMEVQNASIKDLYFMSDSLWLELNKVKVSDSLHINLAESVLQLDSTLIRLAVDRKFSYNLARKRNDTLWQVTMRFRNVFPVTNRVTLDSLLKAKLKAPEVDLFFE